MEGVVRGQVGKHALHHVRYQIDADEVHEPEYGGLWHPDWAARHGVGLLNGEAVVECGLEGALAEEDAKPVPDESRSVVAHSDALAEPFVGEAAEALDDGFVHLSSCDNLQKRHVSWRVEEVGNQEPRGYVMGHPMCEFGARQGRCVG